MAHGSAPRGDQAGSARDDPGEEAALALLRRSSLFADLQGDELAAVARTLQRQRTPRGRLILSQGESGTVAFVIVSGAVDVLLESEDGRQFIAARLGPGDHFGEMALLDAGPRSATVVAAADTDLLLLRRSQLLQYPHIMERMLVALSRRLRRADGQLASLAFRDTTARLAWLLTRNATAGPHGLAVEATQDELAAMIGATRQTVGRIFSAWRRRGYIATDRRRTVLLDAEGLAAVAETERGALVR